MEEKKGISTYCQDRQLWLALLAAPVVWAAMCNWYPIQEESLFATDLLRFSMLVLAYPVVEEIIFRGLLQGQIRMFQWGTVKWTGITAANLFTSLIFALLHLFSHPAIMAMLVFIPSLVFGHFRDRYGIIYVPIALHIYYNFGYFFLYGVA